MSANPIDKNTTPKTTGSLEELFRHHLGEEAAAPPRPMLWDQIDNSLLIRQNETYRKRLAATRWVAAASLLLATLAGTGWWASRDGQPAGAQMATTSQSANQVAAPGVATAPAAPNERGRVPQNGLPAAEIGTTATLGAVSRGALATSAPERGTGFGSVGPNQAFSHRPTTDGRQSQRNKYNPEATSAQSATTNTDNAALATTKMSATDKVADSDKSRFAGTAPQLAANAPTAMPATGVFEVTTAATGVVTATGAATAALAAGGDATAGTLATAPTAGALAAAPAMPEQVGLLATRPSVLSLSNAVGLPNGLVALTLAEEAPVDVSRWHYGASYTAGVFNPNIDFSRAGIAAEYDYNPALGANSPALTEAAATQYREHLRPGFSQRLALLATRHLAGHWSLRTGAEFTQATAQSASSMAFVGEQLLDLGQANNRPLQTTNFRYRTASVPVELAYSNPAKRGWSLYGRIGGVVSALLGVRSEADGYPEATRTYSLTSAGTPYRRVLGDMRGGLGTQFRPSTGNWAFTVGPVAEVGLVSLNAHPVQDLLHQSRAYSFGVEAGVEFGR